jgi:hypothetical protein
MKWKSTKLDDLLREVAAAGELNYLSLTPVAYKGGVGFSATYAPATNCTHEYAVSADPTEAALAAIKNWKGPVRVEQHAKIEPIRPPKKPKTKEPWDL